MIGLLIIILISIFLIGSTSAIKFRQIYNPFTRTLDYYHTANFTGENITAGSIIVSGNVTADYHFGNIPWTNLTNYPVACSSGYAVTEVGDSNICTQFAEYNFGSNNFNGSGNFNTTGNITAGWGFFNGNVGIGTNSPYSGLHYQGDIFYLTPNAGAWSND
ncbi:hypothetical protein LCGC14_1993410, partial [marine sediment metagenome]